MQRKILDAATQEFAVNGYGGARVERISRRARTVDRMLYYYFGSKDRLYRTVLERIYEDLGAAQQQVDLAHLTPSEGMKQLIAFTWNYYCAHPELIRLLNTGICNRDGLRGAGRPQRLRSEAQRRWTHLGDRTRGESLA